MIEPQPLVPWCRWSGSTAQRNKEERLVHLVGNGIRRGFSCTRTATDAFEAGAV
jgi:hypothetical protein